MELLILVAVLTGVFRLLGVIGITIFATWDTAILWGLAGMFALFGVMHFTLLRKDFAQMIPPQLPNREGIILFTGVCELLGGIALVIPTTTRLAGIALVVYLIAVLPANIYAARQNIMLRGQPPPPLWLRIPVQFVLIGLLLWVIH